jgi:hypothetical protein
MWCCQFMGPDYISDDEDRDSFNNPLMSEDIQPHEPLPDSTSDAEKHEMLAQALSRKRESKDFGGSGSSWRSTSVGGSMGTPGRSSRSSEFWNDSSGLSPRGSSTNQRSASTGSFSSWGRYSGGKKGKGKDKKKEKKEIGKKNEWQTALESNRKKDPSSVALLPLLRRLRSSLKPSLHCVRLRSFEDCVTGEAIVEWLLSSEEADNRSGALKLGQRLMEANLVMLVNRDEEEEWAGFHDGPGWLYQMSNPHTPRISHRQSPNAKVSSSAPVAVAVPCLPEDLAVRVLEWVEGYDERADGASVLDMSIMGRGNKMLPSFVLYTVEVEGAGQTWELQKRYREFSELHRELTKLCPRHA